jgi:4-amino-4-deoxy-L-arabinose transferase-like glycosyltransferase
LENLGAASSHCLGAVNFVVAFDWLLAFFWNLGSTGLIDETEPLFAEAARQMTVTEDWITPSSMEYSV